MSFFKRTVPGPTIDLTKPSKQGVSPQNPKPPALAEPLPTPEVIEGNEDSDWALWEDSVAFQDSQMQSEFGTLKAPGRPDASEEKPSDAPDPFGAVRRRSP